MRRVEVSGFPPQDQYVGLAIHTLIKVSVIRSIFFKYVRQTKSNEYLVSYDAEKIYDCMALRFGSFTDKYFQMPLPNLIYVIREIQK